MNVSVERSHLSGRVNAVPSKSHAHRLLMAAALKKGRTEVIGVGDSDDINATLSCLVSLGARVERNDDKITVWGIENPKKGTQLNACESGTTLRFLIPIVAALGSENSFTGRGRLLSRPNEALSRCLSQNGATFDGTKVEGRLHGGRFVIDATVSSQYVSGLLFALPLLAGDSEIVFEGEPVSKKYIEMTLNVLKESDILFERTANGFFLPGGQRYGLPDVVRCEGDWSSAAFMLAAGAIGGRVRVDGLRIDSLQGDKAIVDILKSYGANVTVDEDSVEVCAGERRPITVDLTDIPDLAPVLSVLAAFAKGESKLVSVERLRLKESDRLEAVIQMLNASNITCKHENDTLFIKGGNPKSGLFDGKKDHRMVMSEIVFASGCDGVSLVSDGEAVAKSYPGFLDDFTTIGGKYHVDMEG